MKLASSTLSLLLGSTATVVVATDEWELYGCANANANANPMAACFCGLLKDRKDSSQLTAAEQSTSSGALTPCSGGSAGGFPCENVDLFSHLPLNTFGTGIEANDIWGWTDTASGREFALLGLSDGTAFVEITDPVNPTYLGKLGTQTVNSSWRDIKVYQNHAFIVSEASSHGMQVFDLTELLTVANSPVAFSNTAYYNDSGGLGRAHNIAINEDTGFAYVVGGINGCSGGLHMIDISTPTNPTKAGCYGGDGYVHDTHCVIYNGPDSIYEEREICFCSNEDTVTIVDVTNKASPLQLSRNSYANEGYTHQGWLSTDHKYFVFGDETDEASFGFNTKTLVMDVQDLKNISLAGFYLGGTSAIDHNLYIVGDVIMLSSYRAGLRVLKINDLATADLAEIGYFDIYPSSNSANYNGAWSVFPYFNSTSVVVSGIEQGLFVLSPDLNALPICNNDGSCDPGEDCNNCPNDCGSKTNGNPNSQYCCDGDLPECGNVNCGCLAPTAPPGPTPAPAPTPACGGNQAPCNGNQACCSNKCRNGVCKGNRRRLGQGFVEDVVTGN